MIIDDSIFIDISLDRYFSRYIFLPMLGTYISPIYRQVVINLDFISSYQYFHEQMIIRTSCAYSFTLWLIFGSLNHFHVFVSLQILLASISVLSRVSACSVSTVSFLLYWYFCIFIVSPLCPFFISIFIKETALRS